MRVESITTLQKGGGPLTGIDLESIATSRFDREIATRAYKRWVSGESSLDEAYKLSLPIIGMTIKSSFPSSGVEDEELIREAAFEIFKSIAAKRFKAELYPEECPCYQYHMYMAQICYRAMANALRVDYNQQFDFDFGCTRPPYGQLPKYKDVEFRIFLEQLPSVLQDQALKRIRFSGNERSVCIHILNRLLSGRMIVPKFIRNRFSVKNPKFYVCYVTVVLRGIMYELRDVQWHGLIADDWFEFVSSFEPPYVMDMEGDVE
jgi:hypothetical protein